MSNILPQHYGNQTPQIKKVYPLAEFITAIRGGGHPNAMKVQIRLLPPKNAEENAEENTRRASRRKARENAPKGAPKERLRWDPVSQHLSVASLALPEYKEVVIGGVRGECERPDELGAYFVVNTGGDSDEYITGYTAAFVENDIATMDEQHKRLDAAPLPTSARVETKKSVHAYWFLKPECTKEQWKEIQLRLIAFCDGDPAIKNPSRVMRLPDFDHTTYNKATDSIICTPVICVQLDGERRYTAEEMLAAFPQPVVAESILATEAKKKRDLQVEIPKGYRNDELFRDLCSLRAQGMDDEGIRRNAYYWNETRCNPSMDLGEVDTIINRVCIYPQGVPLSAHGGVNGGVGGGGINRKAKDLVKIGESAELFSETGGKLDTDTYATVPVGDHHETYRIASEEFRAWLLHEYRQQKNGDIVSSNTLQSAIDALKAQAYFNTEKLKPFVRIGEADGRIYYDLGDERWRVVEIDAEGWRILDKSPVKFIRPKGYAAQVEPIEGGRIDELRQFINIKSDADWILFVGWVISSFQPQGVYALLSLAGTQDAAKSTTTKMIRLLIDPSSSLVRSQPKEERDLMVGAKNNWLLAFDNLSYLPEWLSDALCRLSTGGGQANRQNYTDGEEYLFDARRPVVMNGIEELATRPDLVDRTINVFLPSLKDSDRKDEATLYAEYKAVLPRVLGAVFDVLSVALRELPNVEFKNLPRMADVAKFVTAAEPALGWESGTFLETFGKYRKEAKLAALDASTFGSAVYQFMENDGENHGIPGQPGGTWKGTAADLLKAIDKYAEGFDKKHFPKSPRAVSSSLRRLVPNLIEAGITVKLPDGERESVSGKQGRYITLVMTTRPHEAAAAGS